MKSMKDMKLKFNAMISFFMIIMIIMIFMRFMVKIRFLKKSSTVIRGAWNATLMSTQSGVGCAPRTKRMA
jgi:capsule polysaccharide export protein KpsE/RkpR